MTILEVQYYGKRKAARRSASVGGGGAGGAGGAGDGRMKTPSRLVSGGGGKRIFVCPCTVSNNSGAARSTQQLGSCYYG